MAEIPSLGAEERRGRVGAPDARRVFSEEDRTMRRGFRLQELAVAMALIVIVAALAIPNFGDRRPERSQVSRVRADQRVLATAIEAYYVDHNAYPAEHSILEAPGIDAPSERRRIVRAGGTSLATAEWGRPGLDGLTTPLAYVTNVFADPFAPMRGTPYAYHADAKGWLLTSAGPDGDYDIQHPAEVYDSSIPQPSPHLLAGGPWTYDPTNGLVSDGDVWRVRD